MSDESAMENDRSPYCLTKQNDRSTVIDMTALNRFSLDPGNASSVGTYGA
jgi:hypothetical protein